MPFGLSNAPSTMVRVVDCVLNGLLWNGVLAFLDDIIVYSPDAQSHLSSLETLFGRLRENNLKLKPGKCFFFQKQIRYLGHLIDTHGISPLPDKVKAILEMPRPSTKKELRAAIGCLSYYRNHIRKFASLAEPLNRLLKKDVTMSRWGKEQDNAIDTLKSKLSTAPVLAYPDYSRPMHILTDASDVGIGGVLFQKLAYFLEFRSVYLRLCRCINI